MVEDIQTRKDAEGSMPQDIFAAAQEEVGVDWGQSHWPAALQQQVLRPLLRPLH